MSSIIKAFAKHSKAYSNSVYAWILLYRCTGQRAKLGEALDFCLDVFAKPTLLLLCKWAKQSKGLRKGR